MEYGISKKVEMDYEEAIEKVTEELKKEGFGILTTIDIKAKIKEKLGLDMDKYILLGACNPPLAKKAIDVEQEIGLLLPCNVIVYVKEGSTYVSAIRPSVAMQMVDSENLKSLASEVEEKLERVIANA